MRATALVLALAACGDPDPCEGLATCVRLHVQSSTVDRLDTLELDVLYGTRHATTSTQAGGGEVVDLPLVTGVEVATADPIRVGIVAAAKRSGNVLGTGAASAMLDPGAHADVTIDLAPVAACTAGALYCGGDKLAGDPESVYVCAQGAGTQAMRCANGCVVAPAGTDDHCR